MRSPITTHVLDTSTGRPAEGVPVRIERKLDDDWVEMGRGTTDEDGRINDLFSGESPAGTYRLTFETAVYFGGKSHFHPVVHVVFEYAADGRHCHVPLLLNPFGYTTYRGS